MSNWPATKARRVLAALERIGGRVTGGLSPGFRPEFPSFPLPRSTRAPQKLRGYAENVAYFLLLHLCCVTNSVKLEEDRLFSLGSGHR